MMCECIFGYPSVTYHFWVTVTLTHFLNNYCVQSISLIFFEEGIPNLVCICILGCGLSHSVFGTLTSDLVLIIIVSRAYFLYYLR